MSGRQAEKEALLKPSVKESQTEKRTDSKTSAPSSQTTEKETASNSSVKANQKIPRRANKAYRCGLENNGKPLPKWSPRRRIKTTLATPEMQARCQRLIDLILHEDTIFGVRAKLDPNDVMFVLQEVDRYFMSEPVLIEDVPLDVVVLGDIHGQLHDIDRVFRIFAKDGKPGYLFKKYLFLGDYVDRGRQQLEVIMLIFCLKILFPDNFFLLRGNHEFAQQNYRYGFKDELKERYCEESARALFVQCNETFSWMSICAIVGDVYFCAHAGISPSGFSRWSLRELSKPILKATEDVLILDMVWSDPALGLKGSVFNFHRGSSVYFGLDVLTYSLTRVQCVALIRGHSVMNDGFDSQWGCCHTVFTATNTTNSENDGSCLWIDEKGKFHVHILKMNKARYEVECELFDQEENADSTRDDCGTGQAADLGEYAEEDEE